MPLLSCREGQSRAKELSNMIKQKRKEKAVRTLSHVLTPVCTAVCVTHRGNGLCHCRR